MQRYGWLSAFLLGSSPVWAMQALDDHSLASVSGREDIGLLVARVAAIGGAQRLVLPAALKMCIRDRNCTSGCAGGWTDALLGAFASNNCSILGIQTCFNLSQFQSLPVGNTVSYTQRDVYKRQAPGRFGSSAGWTPGAC